MIKRAALHFTAFLAASLVFSATLAVPALVAYGFMRHASTKLGQEALAHAPDPLGTPLEGAGAARAYAPTVQSLGLPVLDEALIPMRYLVETENCVLACRMDQLKNLGVVPGHWGMKRFLAAITNHPRFAAWQLHRWTGDFSGETAEAIDRALNPKSTRRFRWVDIASGDELLHLARRGQPVLTSITCWLRPKSGGRPPRRYLGVNITHAVTITGLARWVSNENLVEYAVDDPLPGIITRYPVYTAVCSNGWNLLGRQGTPFIVQGGPHFRSGYLAEVFP